MFLTRRPQRSGVSCAGNRDLAWRSGQTLLVSDTPVIPLYTSFRRARDWRASGRWVDPQGMVLTGQGSQCGCYLRKACADVGCRGPSSSAIGSSGINLRAPPVLRHGPLTLDPARHRCTRDGAELDLTPREFAVLGYLPSPTRS